MNPQSNDKLSPKAMKNSIPTLIVIPNNLKVKTFEKSISRPMQKTLNDSNEISSPSEDSSDKSPCNLHKNETSLIRNLDPKFGSKQSGELLYTPMSSKRTFAENFTKYSISTIPKPEIDRILSTDIDDGIERSLLDQVDFFGGVFFNKTKYRTSYNIKGPKNCFR